MTETLTGRLEMFCQQSVLTGCATDAARRANYSRQTARTQGWRLLRHPAVKARIAALRAERTANAAAFGAALWQEVEYIRVEALQRGQYTAALRAVAAKVQLYERLGLPARPPQAPMVPPPALAPDAEDPDDRLDAQPNTPPDLTDEAPADATAAGPQAIGAEEPELVAIMARELIHRLDAAGADDGHAAFALASAGADWVALPDGGCPIRADETLETRLQRVPPS